MKGVLKIGFMLTVLLNPFGFNALAQERGERAQDASAATSLFTLLDSIATGVSFTNRVVETNDLNIFTNMNLYNGGGVAVGDIDQDGLQDLYFVSNFGPDRLYLNEGGMRFRDISHKAGIDTARGYKTGVAIVDVNADGRPDIHVSRDAVAKAVERRNLLYINNGDLTFTERAQAFGLADTSHSTQAHFFDMDLDGDLDMLLVNHPNDLKETMNLDKVTAAGGTPVGCFSPVLRNSDRLYRNDGGRFTDVTKAAGVCNSAFGLSAMVGHFNDDLFPDVYVCNDFVKPDHLWINQGDGTFVDRFADQFPSCAMSSMGSDIADINNDGLADLMVLDMTPRDHYRYKTQAMMTNFDRFWTMQQAGLCAQYPANMLQLNNGNGTFSNIGFLAGVAYTDWSWTPLLADLDNDGWKDAVVANGLLRDLTHADFNRFVLDSLLIELRAGRMDRLQWTSFIPSVRVRSYLFRNEHDLTFSDRSEEWNAGPPAFSNGAAYGDLDNDGDLDLVFNNLNDPAFILRNNGERVSGNDHIRIALRAGKGRTAIGSRVELVLADGSSQVQWIQPVRGFLSCSEPIAHFGLGQGAHVERVEVTWPDGAMNVMEHPAVNALHTIVQKASRPKPPVREAGTPLFSDRSAQLPQSMRHEENRYIDFKREPLLHRMYSQEGPAVAVGDVNGDGTDDVFLGGAMNSPARLFLQAGDGSFTLTDQRSIARDSTAEDVAALFFDADGDGDADLYVGSGGNERPDGDAAYADRLYRNDGTGRFTRVADALPPAFSSTGCVQAHDIDADGDLDLFVGARISPGRYPVAPASQLLRNDGGRFTDMTEAWSEGLRTVGMVTDARFADLDADGVQELVVVGEWMPVTIFQWSAGRYHNVTDAWGLGSSHGWWCSVAIGDPDRDGLPDILAGNDGLNGPWVASPDRPVTIHYKDFDANGTMDPVLCAYWDDQAYPVHLRDRMLDQMVMLKKRFLRYEPYAKATLDDIFTPEERSGEQRLQVTTFAHTWFRQKRAGMFSAEVLPNAAQLSMARANLVLDADQDGLQDVIVAGNHFGTDPQFGRSDASVGLLLKGHGDGTFEVVPPAVSGPLATGDVRKLVPITVAGYRCLLVVRNNDRCGLIGLPSMGNKDQR